MKAVFDTNVLVAAFLTEGLCAKALVRARKHEFHLTLSTDIMKETEQVLRRKFKLSPFEVVSVLSLLNEAAAETLEKVNPVSAICRDPDDNKILACAEQAHADYIVTGDKDLLVMKRYGKAKIVIPRDFERLFTD
jgi:uncharacterized protein